MRRFLPFLVLAILAAPLVGRANAHGTRAAGGHVWTVGWAVEPALVGQPNAVQVSLTEEGARVEGADKELKVEVRIGDETTDPLDLETVSDAPGEYRAAIIPTVPGDYTFRFIGRLDGEKVDESFTASKDDFSLVESAGDLAFPKKAPTNTELAERLETIEQTANDAEDAIGTSRLLAVVGIVLALVGIAIAARSRKGTS